MGNRPNVLEDVWKYIDKRGDDECWPYIGGRTRSGYGVFAYRFKVYKAHRVVYSLTHGGIDLSAPKDNYQHGFILHRCDNPSCCNPKHLYAGEIFSNMRDKVLRGRQARAGGRPALTRVDAGRIREQRLFGAATKDLAQVYGVGMCVIYGIIENRTYR